MRIGFSSFSWLSFSWLCVFGFAGCATRAKSVRLQIEPNGFVFEEKDGEKARLHRLKVALERLRLRKISPGIVRFPPIVKLVPPKVELPAEETVADSSDEWMHHYYRGLSFVAEGEVDKATGEFQAFLKNEPGHVYADRALYWIVEVYYRGREFGLCVLCADDFMITFLHSVRRPEVLYRRALCLKQMGQKVAAMETLKELLRRHPQSRTAENATKRLSQWATEVPG